MKYCIVLIALSLFTCKSQSDSIHSISVDEAKTMIEGNDQLIIVDARTPEEFADGHLDGAINVDVKADDFTEQILKMSKEESYLVYCRSGKRSTKASNIMADQGFKTLYNMDGGYLAWTE